MNKLHPTEKELRVAYNFVRKHPFPSVPEVANRIRGELAGPEPELSRLIDLIGGDVGLAGQVLKTVNSAAFGYSGIESVQQAVTLIGLERLESLVLAAYIENMLPASSRHAQQVLEDSRLLALAAMNVWAEVIGTPSHEAYLAGLMLYSGAVFLSEQLGEDYRAVFEIRAQHPINFNALEERRVGTSHSTVGYLFAQHWRLPETISLAIHLYHRVACSQIEDDNLRSLLAVLKLADYLVVKRNSAELCEPSIEVVQHLARVRGELMIDSTRLDEFEQLLT